MPVPHAPESKEPLVNDYQQTRSKGSRDLSRDLTSSDDDSIQPHVIRTLAVKAVYEVIDEVYSIWEMTFERLRWKVGDNIPSSS